MSEIERNMRSVLSSLIISLLIGAQTISLAHSTEHDFDLLQDSCPICIGSSQLSSTATDSGQSFAGQISGPVLSNIRQYLPEGTFTEAPRQRGPPKEL